MQGREVQAHRSQCARPRPPPAAFPARAPATPPPPAVCVPAQEAAGSLNPLLLGRSQPRRPRPGTSRCSCRTPGRSARRSSPRLRSWNGLPNVRAPPAASALSRARPRRSLPRLKPSGVATCCPPTLPLMMSPLCTCTVAQRRSLFDDPAEEINEMTAIIKQ